MANLINPAFSGLLLREFVLSFEKESSEKPEALLLFLALPLILHRETRTLLPSTTATRHHTWLERTPQARVGFAARAAALAPFVREAISFACGSKWLELHPPYHVGARKLKMKSKSWINLSDNSECLHASQFMGKWLAQAGPTTTIFGLWGVRP